MKVAVLLPHAYAGGTLRAAKNLARKLALGARAHGQDAQISFGYLANSEFYEETEFDDLRRRGIACRPFSLQLIELSSLAPYYREWLRLRSPLTPSPVLLFNDGICNFEDCDFWIVVSDRISTQLPPHRKYAVAVYDYTQRYVPEILGMEPSSDGNWLLSDQWASFVRGAKFVLCTTHQTRTDCLAITGADPARVHIFPMEFDPLEVDEQTNIPCSLKHDAENYLLWTTSTTQHKNHLTVIQALELYFEENPGSDIEIRLCGALTDLFLDASKGRPFFDHPYISRVRTELSRSALLRDRVKILGHLPDREYLRQLRSARACLHAAQYDNGSFAVVEAAWHRVPTLSADYPAMREMSAFFSVPLTFFSPFSPRSLAESLRYLLAHYDEAVAALPTREHLRQFSYESCAAVFWERFSRLAFGA